MKEGRWTVARRALRELFAAVFDAVVPGQCPACGAASDGTCAVCRRRLSPTPSDGCARCGAPLLAPEGRCRADHTALAGIAMRRAAWSYAGTGGAIVRRFKFDGDPAAGRVLVNHSADRIRGWAQGPGRRAVFVNVPIHPRKLRLRGFDQAARIAEGVALVLGRRFVPGVLRRVVDTLPQGDPRVTSRRRNVEGAFLVVRPRTVRGRTVVLVDDVSTSGATARECARVLRAAGAREIVLLTAALG